MKILVCFQIVYDFESVLEEDWESLSTDMAGLEYVRKKVDYYGEAALESALRLNELFFENGVESSVAAVTMAAGKHNNLLSNLYAVGFDEVLWIRTEAGAIFSPYRTASHLAELAKDFDIVLTGHSGSSGQSGLVPAAVAHLLNRPCIERIVDIGPVENGIRVSCQTDTGLRHGTVLCPAVYTVGNVEHPYLRIATLREKLAASKHSFKTIDAKPTENCLPSDFTLQKLYRINKPRNCDFIVGETVDEQAQTLWTQCLKENVL